MFLLHFSFGLSYLGSQSLDSKGTAQMTLTVVAVYNLSESFKRESPELIHVQQSFILCEDFDHDEIYSCPANDIVNHTTCSF